MALIEEMENQGNWLFIRRSNLQLIFLPVGLAIYCYMKLNPNESIFEDNQYEVFWEYACLAVSLFGLVIRCYTVGFSAKNTSGRNTTEGQVADTVNTTGIYSTVRHPLYLGNFLMWFGPVLLTANLWFCAAFIFIYWVYYERIMFAEEAFLRKKFGQVYIDWSNKTPAFIPKWKNFNRAELDFSWKKVLKKEKNGLFATFLIFAAFNILGQYLEKEQNYNWFFIFGCVATMLLYGVLKYMKYNTKMLEVSDR